MTPNVFSPPGALNYAMPPNPLMALGKEAKGAGTVPNPAALDPFMFFMVQPPPMTDVESLGWGATTPGKTTDAQAAWWLLKFLFISMSLKALLHGIMVKRWKGGGSASVHPCTSATGYDDYSDCSSDVGCDTDARTKDHGGCSTQVC